LILDSEKSRVGKKFPRSGVPVDKMAFSGKQDQVNGDDVALAVTFHG